MKKLIIFFDGTSNKFEEKNTNVVKAYRVISSENQIKCYIPGVGSMKNQKYYFLTKRVFKKIMGLAFGYGLQERVLESYLFLSKNYQPGDEIYFFGFSRGSYTAKVLAGLIHECGLMEHHNSYNMQYAYNLYSARNPNFKTMKKFKNTFSKYSPQIKFMGLWDSVSSVGNLIQMRNYPHTSNVKNVSHLRHAIAVDEKRFMFMNNTSNSTKDNIQMWFPGVHTDVGGGQKESESQLSKIALKWILEEAAVLNLDLNENSFKRYVEGTEGGNYSKPSATGKIHKNLFLWYLLNFIPRFKVTQYKPKKKYKFFVPLIRYRKIRKEDKIHESVFLRMAAFKKYKPKNVIKWQEDNQE